MTATSTVAVADDVRRAELPRARGFERWGLGAYLVVVLALAVAILARLGGRLVYVLDDPAIHLSIADKLVRHGTWGVAAGSFESASSSPLWTLLVAAGLAVTPAGAEEWVPLVLNVVAGLGVVVVLGRSQSVLQPTRRTPLEALATVVLVVVALFLPGLAVVGMEHTLHVLLVLAAVVLVQQGVTRERQPEAAPAWGPTWLPYLLLVLATLTRFETAFVAAGLAAGLALADGDVRAALAARRRQIAGVVAGAAVPIVVFAAGNRALGGGLLPNSVLAKGQGGSTGASQNDGLGPSDIVGRLTQDPLLGALVALGVVYLIVTWGRPAGHRLTAVTLVVASVLHATLADTGWFERYQAYLIAVGVYLVLGILAELPAEARRRALLAVVVLVITFGTAKATLLVRASRAADDMYRQQYQAGRFLERYYDGQPIATDQLGYISYFHEGPVTDFAGLGDYEVLQEMPGDRAARSDFWQWLTDERGFVVAAVYDTDAALGAPSSWVLGGTLHSDGEPVTGVTQNLQIWSTTPDADAVRALHDDLVAFEPELPDRMSLDINDFAGFQASAKRDRLALEAMAADAAAADADPGADAGSG
jgi:hypothetical protein